jgi:hypothetical protein
VACPQGVEGLGMAGPGETLGSPWPPLAIGPCLQVVVHRSFVEDAGVFVDGEFVVFQEGVGVEGRQILQVNSMIGGTLNR